MVLEGMQRSLGFVQGHAWASSKRRASRPLAISRRCAPGPSGVSGGRTLSGGAGDNRPGSNPRLRERERVVTLDVLDVVDLLLHGLAGGPHDRHVQRSILAPPQLAEVMQHPL